MIIIKIEIAVNFVASVMDSSYYTAIQRPIVVNHREATHFDFYNENPFKTEEIK